MAIKKMFVSFYNRVREMLPGVVVAVRVFFAMRGLCIACTCVVRRALRSQTRTFSSI